MLGCSKSIMSRDYKKKNVWGKCKASQMFIDFTISMGCVQNYIKSKACSSFIMNFGSNMIASKVKFGF